MDHQSLTSHPNSNDSSPSSREFLENDHRSSFDEPPPPPPPQPPHSHSISNRVKLMCSYGGKIQPRLRGHHFTYFGGDTKIIAVDRAVKLTTLVSKLSTMANFDVCFKYQLPGEDLDALISVCNDEDLDHMMVEYDRLCRVSPKPARLRLFLFPAPVVKINNDDENEEDAVSAVILAAVEDTKSEGQWFIDALNSANVPPLEESPPPPPTLNPDYLFGLDKPYTDDTPVAEFPVTVPDLAAKDAECGTETVKETEITEVVERTEFVVNIEQEVKIVDGENGGINGGFDCNSITEENAEKVIPLVTNDEPVQNQNQIQTGLFQVQIPEPVPVHQSVQSLYSPVRHHNVVPAGGGYSIGGYRNEPVPVYLIQTPSGLYQAVRPVTGPSGQPVYFAYVNKFDYNGVVSEHGYSSGSYFSDRSSLSSATAPGGGGDGWN